MICELCGVKPATVYLSKTINGNQIEMYLCESCAKEKGSFNLDSNYSIQNFLTNLIKASDNNVFKTEEAVNKTIVSCPKCGLTYQEFKKIGKFGCNECYITFNQLIKPIIKKIQGNSYHCGKVPIKSVKKIETKNVIEELQKSLSIAVQEEDYEKAAQIRDEIKRIKKERSI